MIRRTALLLALLVCAAAPGTEAMAGAARAAHVSGEYALVDLGTTACEPLDATRLRCHTSGLRFAYSGDLVGESTAELEQVIDCATSGTTGQGVETFTGSLGDGDAGTVTWRLRFRAEFDCATFFPSNLRIVAVVTRSTGGLAGSHGVLFFDDTTYRGILG